MPVVKVLSVWLYKSTKSCSLFADTSLFRSLSLLADISWLTSCSLICDDCVFISSVICKSCLYGRGVTLILETRGSEEALVNCKNLLDEGSALNIWELWPTHFSLGGDLKYIEQPRSTYDLFIRLFRGLRFRFWMGLRVFYYGILNESCEITSI